MEATLDRFGRVVIPKRVREHLGLTPGTVLEVEEGGREIHLRPAHEEPQVADRDGVLVFTGKATGDVLGALRRERKHRLERVTDTTTR